MRISGRVLGWYEQRLRRRLPPGVTPTDAEGRARIGSFEGGVSAALSVSLAGAKAVLAWFTGSISLWADAANNLADIGSSLVVILGCRWSRKPRDREHPFGHGRVELLTTLILAMILVGVAIEVARAGLGRILSPSPVEAPRWVLVAIGVTVVAKILMTFWVYALVRVTRSTLLEADMWNHGFDIASTSLVLVALVGANIGWQRLDGWAALGVAGLIAWTGVRYVREASGGLIGQAPSAEELALIRRIACRVPGVRAAHNIIIHRYGDVRVMSLHIEVDACLSVLDAHELAERVESELAEEQAVRVTVHVDPVDRSHALYHEVDSALQAVVREFPVVVGYHDLRLDGPPPRHDMMVDLVVRADVPSTEFSSVMEQVRQRIHETIPGVGRIDLGVETEYASEHERRRIFRRGKETAGGPG